MGDHTNQADRKPLLFSIPPNPLSSFFILLLFFSSINSHAYADEFNNISLIESGLSAEVERSFSMGIASGFGGIRPFSEIELLNIYNQTQGEDIKKNILTAGLSSEGESPSSYFYIEPISDIKFSVYEFSTDVPDKKRYCLENIEGTCIDEGLTTFLNLAGQGRLFKKITFFYEGQIKDSSEGVTGDLKKAYLKLKTGIVSWEFGKDSIWLGHGYHGSLLLSNNAEPFPMIKLNTEEPLHIPYLGQFQYTLFHGWLDDFNIMGHRLAWKPWTVVEFGANQTSVYSKNHDYKIWEWPRIFSASEENTPGSKYGTDQRASLDIALYLPFLGKIPPLKGGKLYAEYAGEDLVAAWQPEDKHLGWIWPFGFDFLTGAYMIGGMVTTGDTDIRVEYTENYKSTPLFFDIYKYYNLPYYYDANEWYVSGPYFTYGDSLLGHHMGRDADDLFLEISHKFRNLTLKVFYDKERHRIYEITGSQGDNKIVEAATPEFKYQHGLDVSYKTGKYEINALIVYNEYKNVSGSTDPLNVTPVQGMNAYEWITGVGIKYFW